MEWWVLDVGLLHYSSTPLLRLIPPTSSACLPERMSIVPLLPPTIPKSDIDVPSGFRPCRILTRSMRRSLSRVTAVLAKLRSRAHSLCTSQTCKREVRKLAEKRKRRRNRHGTETANKSHILDLGTRPVYRGGDTVFCAGVARSFVLVLRMKTGPSPGGIASSRSVC